MKRQMEEVRSRLGELGALAGKTEEAERRILKSAEERLAEVNRAIERHKPGVDTAPATTQDRYLDLVSERGQLQIVISQAKRALGVE